MKSSYKYRLVFDDDWYFELLPNNNNDQFVGKSEKYPTKDEAVSALHRFKEFLSGKEEIDYTTEILPPKEEKQKSNKYRGIFSFSNEEMFSTRSYYHRYEAENGIQRILANYNTSVRTDLEKVRSKK